MYTYGQPVDPEWLERKRAQLVGRHVAITTYDAEHSELGRAEGLVVEVRWMIRESLVSVRFGSGQAIDIDDNSEILDEMP